MTPGDTIRIRIKLDDAALFAKDVREATIEIDGLGDAAARAEKKSKRASSGLNILQKVLKLIKPAGLIAAFGLLTQTISAMAAGAIGLVSALAPLGGLLATIPGFRARSRCRASAF